MNRQIKGTLQLTLTSLIWGVAFVAQSVGMDYVGPWTFICARYVLGGVALIPLIYVLSAIDHKKHLEAKKPGLPADSLKDPVVRSNTIKGGVLCGVFLVSASLFQQYGIINNSVGKAGFITALYIIIVPFLSIFFHKKIGLNEWVSAILAVIGFYIMSIQGKPNITQSDLLLLICAILFSMQILTIDHFVDKVNTVAMSSIQFFVSAFIGSIGMLILESPAWSDIIAAAVPILYAGLMSSGVAYTLQIIGQKNLEPTLASLLMSLESVFSALAGYVILKQTLRKEEIVGCAIVFAAVILAQIPVRSRK